MGTLWAAIRPGAWFRRNWYAAETGTLRGAAGCQPRRRRSRYAQRGDLRRNGYASGRKPRECVLDSAWITRFAMLWSTSTVIRGAHRAESGTLWRENLWKSRWNHRVIPAESGSPYALKRVRFVADSGSGLRRNEYGSTQNRVRRGQYSALKSSTYTSRIRFTSS